MFGVIKIIYTQGKGCKYGGSCSRVLTLYDYGLFSSDKISTGLCSS